MKTTQYHKYQEIKDYIIDNLSNYEDSEIEASEIHNELFNTDYYIIGTYDAEQWLGSKVFEIIEIIKEYEEDNFGEVNTDFSDPEKVVNMYVYILGELILGESNKLMDVWDNKPTNEDIKEIIEELEG